MTKKRDVKMLRVSTAVHNRLMLTKYTLKCKTVNELLDMLLDRVEGSVRMGPDE